MHVLHVEAGRNLYGGARQALYLMAGLEDRDIRGTLVCAAGGAPAAAAVAEGLDVVEIPMHGDLNVGLVRRLGTLIRQIRPDLVHVHSRRGADWFGGIAARRSGTPAILSRRVDSHDMPLLASLKYRSFDTVIAISECIRLQLAAAGVPAAKLRVVRSAIDPARSRATWQRERYLAEFSLRATDPTIAVVAQFIQRKGHRHLIAALEKILPTHPEVRVLFFGRGPLEQNLRSAVAAAGLTDVIRFAGFRDDLREFLGHVDLLVHPAEREGLGVSLLEAQAAGVPVVAFNAGAISEAVADGRTGILVPIGDTDALAAEITGLLADPGRRRKFSVAATHWIGTEFGIDRMVQGNLDVYRQICKA
jgi:glycosyltransferase involved in cell wall biosynthesis